MTTSTFEGLLKIVLGCTVQQAKEQSKEKKTEGPAATCFPRILKENNRDDLFSKSKKSLLRNTKSDKLYILGVRWIARLAFVRRVNRRARAIARLLLTGLKGSELFFFQLEQFLHM